MCVLAFLGSLVFPFLLWSWRRTQVYSRDMVFEASVSRHLGPLREPLRAHDLDVAWPLRVYPRVLV